LIGVLIENIVEGGVKHHKPKPILHGRWSMWFEVRWEESLIKI